MTLQTIQSVLSSHGLDYSVVNGRIIALDTIHVQTRKEFFIDVTDYSRERLYSWLGYDVEDY